MTTLFSSTKYINGEMSSAGYQLGTLLSCALQEQLTAQHTLVILCIGTDRATGDCLGPLVGEQLSTQLRHFAKTHPLFVYGTLSSPVHALNLEDTIDDIYDRFPHPFILAIDAALGSHSHIGYVTLSPHSILPGKGVKKKLPAIGDLSITGIVNLSGFSGCALLQSTRLNTVMKLSRIIASGISYSLHQLYPTPTLPCKPQSPALPCRHSPLP